MDLNKHRNIRCSNWEAEVLSEEQIKYAAQDALASLGLCLKLVSDIMFAAQATWNFQFSDAEEMFIYWQQSSTYQLDRKYKQRYKAANGGSLTPKRATSGTFDPTKVKK